MFLMQSRSMRAWRSGVFLTVVLIGGVRPSAAQQEQPLQSGAVDTESSRVYVFVGKKGFGQEHGMEGKVKEGEITLGKADSAGTIVFDMPSFEADTEAARKYVKLDPEFDQDKAKINATMKSKAVLDVEQFPTATFKINSAQRMQGETGQENTRYQLDGEFTLRGKTKPLRVTAAATAEQGGKVHLVGDFTIKQTDYGIKPYSAGFGLAAVTDELKIYGDIRLLAKQKE